MAAQCIIGYTKKPLVFKVRRRPPELITPAGPTPYEFKDLSDIDDQAGHRFHIPGIVFYENNEEVGSAMRGRDPVKVVKEAVAKALLPYYPLAGRLREKAGMKLVVECNGKGVMFIEADADVSLKEFGNPLHPPFPCFEELLYDLPANILDTPLFCMQVTRLKCGGFIIAFGMNHCIADAQGIAQFIKAVSELACGAQTPWIQPVWERHLLSARNPPRVTCEHRMYDETTDIRSTVIPSDDMIQYRSFYFGPSEVATLRRVTPSNLKFSTFEVITACLWQCYTNTIALQLDPEDEVRLAFVVNARSLFEPRIPSGYYGNAHAFALAFTTAAKLSNSPLSYALDLVKKAKGEITQEYMMSLADLMVLKGRPQFIGDYRTFAVSDVTRDGLQSIELDDFGWGQPAYIGPAEGGIGAVTSSFYTSYKNGKEEKGIVISVRLPRNVMGIFVQELNKLFYDASKHPLNSKSSNVISSKM